MACCTGPAEATVDWQPCAGGGPLSAVGYLGVQKVVRGDTCPVSRAVWTTSAWSLDAYPSLGETVGISSASWFVDAVTSAGCSVVLKLCRPLLECPDCQVSVYRLSRTAATPEDCQEQLAQSLIVGDVPATICQKEQRRRIVDDAEILETLATICLDTVFEVHAGDLVVCWPEVWRVQRVLSPCSSTCLLTFEAMKEPWHLHSED